MPLGCNLAGRGKTARPITQVAATAVNPIARKSIYLSAKLRPNRESPFYERIVDPNKVETLAVSDSQNDDGGGKNELGRMGGRTAHPVRITIRTSTRAGRCHCYSENPCSGFR